MEITIKLVLSIVMAAHGIGHTMGVLSIPLNVINENGYTHSSWLLSQRLGLGDQTVKAIGVLWLLAAVGFIVTSIGYWQGLAWWRTLAWASLALSFGLFATWWNAFPWNIPIQANLGNLVVLVALLWQS